MYSTVHRTVQSLTSGCAALCVEIQKMHRFQKFAISSFLYCFVATLCLVNKISSISWSPQLSIRQDLNMQYAKNCYCFCVNNDCHRNRTLGRFKTERQTIKLIDNSAFITNNLHGGGARAGVIISSYYHSQ